MKVARFSVPVSAILVIGLNQSALAGPQSLLDPYCTVKPPTRKVPAKKPQMVTPRVVPTSVQLGEPLVTGKKEKPASDKPLASSQSVGRGNGGFLAGTKEIFHGIGTATKAAVVTPTMGLVNGTKAIGGKVADGTKTIGGKVADGTKGLGGKVADGTKKVAEGTKGLGEKVADGTKSSGGFLANGMKKMAIVPKKMGEGLKVAGGKVKDGSVAAGHALAAAPKALGHGAKTAGEKVADGTKAVTEKVADGAKATTEKVADTTGAAATKVKDGGESVGGKVLAMPKAAAKGIAGAATKTGEATKKLATAPLGLIGKLNPFHHKEEAPKTAAKQNVTP